MIFWADKSRDKELIHLWEQSFGDNEEYISMFLEWNALEIKIAAYEADNKIVSVAYLLPVSYCDKAGKKVLCRYLYAAATLPQYRSKGYFAALLKYIQTAVEEPVILVPGEASLVDYYEKQGFFIWQEKKTMELLLDKKKALKELEVTEISAAEYLEIREGALENQSHMQWDTHFMAYICHENTYCGGKQVRIKADEKEYVAMYRITEDTLHISEILPQDNVEACVQALLQQTGCKQAEVCLKPLTMATDRLCKCETGYFNLTMG